MDKVLNTQKLVSSKLGHGYITINGQRELWLYLRKIEMKATINSADVPRLGTLVNGSRVTSMNYAGTITVYKVNPKVDNMVQQMADTGFVPYFDIQTVNEDPTAGNGRDVKLIKDCHIDGDIIIAQVDDEGEFLEQDVGVKASSVQPLEKFTADNGIIAG